MPPLTQRIADAIRAPVEGFARTVSDRVERVLVGPSTSAPAAASPLPEMPTGIDLADPAKARNDLLQRAAPGPLSRGMETAISSGVFRGEGSPRRNSRELVALYRESPWLRATAHKVGSSVAAAEWKVYARRSPSMVKNPEGPRSYVHDLRLLRARREERHTMLARGLADGELEEFPTHPFHRLLDQPNPSMSGFAARLVTTIHIDILGDAFWILEANPDGLPIRFWPIPAQWVESIPTRERPWFEVRFPGEAGFVGHVPPDRMLWFRDVDPGDPYGRGAGLGMTLADELDTDEAASKTVKSFFQNSAIPALLVSLKGAGQDVVTRARLQWEKQLTGFRRAYQSYFTGAEIDVQRLDTTFKDMALVDLRKSVRDAVIQTWGVPPEKLAIIENSNRSTIEAADLIFTKDVVVPRLELQRIEFQRIVTLWDSRLIVDYVSPVPDDIERKRNAIQANADIYTIDEQREVAGLQPLPNKMGEAFLTAPGKIYTPDLRAFAQGTPIYAYHLSAGILTNNEMRTRLGLGETSEPWGNERTVGFYSPFGPMSSSGGLLESGDDDVIDGELVDDEAQADDVDLDPAATATVQEELARKSRDKRSLAMAKKTWKRSLAHRNRASALSVKNLRALLSAIDVNSLAGSLEPVLARLVEAFGQETLDALESTKRFDVQDPAVQEHIREQLQDRIARLMNKTTRENIRDAVTEWDGDDDEELVQGVRSVFDSARVERSQAIAETEGQRSKEFATHQAMVQSAIIAKKEWIAVGDSRTREAHLAMDGQVVGLDEPFVCTSGRHRGAMAQTPGAFGIAELDIRCRCQSAPVYDLDDDDDEVPEEGRAAAKQERLLRAGILTTRATDAERAALWKAQDSKLRSWEAKLSDAAVEGFDAQEERVLEALTKILG